MTAGYRYQTGPAHLAIGPAGGLLTPDPRTALRLWPLISRGAPLAALLEEALTEGLAQLPDLVLFEVSVQTLRVVVRGKLAITVETADGPAAHTDGQAVRSWTELVFTSPSSFRAGDAAGADLPVVSGIVLAGGFAWTAATQDFSDELHGPAAMKSIAPQLRKSEPPPVVPEFPSAAGSGPAEASSLDAPSTRAAPNDASAVVASSPPEGPPQLRDTRVEPIDDSFEHLFESTIMRSVEDAAVRSVEDEHLPGNAVEVISDVPADPSRSPEISRQESDLPTVVRPGDHDGSTIMAGQLAALLASTGESSPASTSQAALSLLLSTGQSISLDRSVIIGRRPQVDRVSGNQIPHLVTVPSPQQDISRSHVAVRPTLGGCVAVDLGSTNGSVIRRSSGEVVDLRGSASLDLQPGDVIDLGDGITAQLRESS